MQPAVEIVMAEGLEQELDVRGLQPCIGFHEGADLRRRNGQGAASQQQILQPDLQLPHSARHHVVDRQGQLALVGDQRAIVILEILAHSRQVVHDVDAELRELAGRPDARQEQKFR